MNARADEPGDLTRREGLLAFRNALKLGASLFLTWGLGLLILRELPNYLGPEYWGAYKYGYDVAATLAVFLHFGVDTYISREIPVRPAHASDFFGGVVVLRTVLLVPLFAYGWVEVSDKLPEERAAAALFGLAQLFIVMNLTFQQILQAASNVDRLAVANVIAKALTGGGTLAAVLLRAPFWVLPLPTLAAEALKAFVLLGATRSAVGLELRVDVAATRKMLVESLPFFVAIGAVYIGASVDTVLLRRLAPLREVGWYTAARDVARLSAILMPVLTGVLVPMMSRAMHHEEKEFVRILRRGMEGVSVVSIPLTLMLALFPELVIRVVLKSTTDFLPAAHALRWLAPTFVLAYANSLLWLALMIMKRSWTIAILSLGGMALLPVFILIGVRETSGLGPGGGATGVAIAISARELVLVLAFLAVVGRRALDRRGVVAILASLAICGVVVGVHAATERLGLLRLVTDSVVYLALAVALRVLRPAEIKAVLLLIKNRKSLA